MQPPSTAFRVIALQPLPEGCSLETELGKMFSPRAGLFVQGLSGVGGDRRFDWGAAVGLRVNF